MEKCVDRGKIEVCCTIQLKTLKVLTKSVGCQIIRGYAFFSDKHWF